MISKNGSNGKHNVALVDNAAQVPPTLDRGAFLNGRKALTEETVIRGQELTANAMLMAREFLNKFADPRRDIDDECGYPKSDNFGADKYWDLYEREPVANRVVNLMPRESWQATPLVYESEDSDEATEFEQAWDRISQDLRGENSWFQDERGSIVWEYLKRLDEMAGIGHFGIMLLGLTDGKELHLPVAGVMPDGRWAGAPSDTADKLSKTPPNKRLSKLSDRPAGTDAQYRQLEADSGGSGLPSKKGEGIKLVYLRVFPEHLVQISQYESDPSHVRFGQPIEYQVVLNDPSVSHSGIGLSQNTVRVHWSRVIHVADNLTSNETFGTPRMKPVLNRLLDLKKVYGGDAEAYWKNCLMKLLLETLPEWADLGGTTTGMKDELEKFGNGLQGYLALTGFSGKTVAPAVVDPTSHINVQIEAICIQLGCPIRVFKGSERGELASSQDDASWNDRIRSRQNTFNTPRVVVPFVDRLITIGVLPKPKGEGAPEPGDELVGNRRCILESKTRKIIIVNAETGKKLGEVSKSGYSIEWPDLDSLSERDKADIFNVRVQAYATAIGGNVESLFTPLDMMTKLDGMDEEEAESVLDAAAKAVEEKEAEALELAEEQGMLPEPPPGFQAPPEEVPQAPIKVKPGEKLVNPATI